MKLDENLRPISEDGNNDDNDDGGRIHFRSSPGGSGSSRGDANGEGAGSSLGNGETGGNGGESGNVGDDLPLGLPLGDPESTRRNDPTRNGSRGNRRGGSRGGNARNSRSVTATDSGSGTEATAFDASAPAPREVKLSAVGGRSKPTVKEIQLNKTFIAEGYVLLFDAVGYAVRDKETWELERDGDAQELASRTVDWLKSLDPNRSAKWEKMLAKWQPFLMLMMALIAVLGPRIAATSTKRKNALASQSQNKAGAGGNTGQGRTPVANADSQPLTQPVIRPEPASGPRTDGAVERPIRRTDWLELSGETLTRDLQ